MQANMTDDPVEAFTEVGIATLLMLMFIGLILLLNKTLYAYIQVVTAILVCENVIAVFIVPVIIWLTVSEASTSYYLLTLLFLWNYAVITHILRQVLSINIPAGMALSLLYFITIYLGAFALGQLL